MLSSKLKHSASQEEQGKENKALKPNIAVSVPLLFAHFRDRKKKLPPKLIRSFYSEPRALSKVLREMAGI